MDRGVIEGRRKKRLQRARVGGGRLCIAKEFLFFSVVSFSCWTE